MPRRPRLFIPGGFYHVMARGIDDRDIFVDDTYRQRFCDLLQHHLQQVGYQCLAWALMTNHYHLVLRASDRPLADLMKPLNSRYARYHAWLQERRGYLFQDRFRSVASQDQGYVERLVRYVHLNPLRAGLCKSLEHLANYRWCGHGALMGRFACPFQDVRQVLRRFGPDTAAARTKYLEFVSEGAAQPDVDAPAATVRRSNDDRNRRGEPGCWVIGDPDFVTRAIAADDARRLNLRRYLSEGWDLDRLRSHVARRLHVAPSAVMRRSRRTAAADARKVLAYLGYRELEIPISHIARYLRITPGAVSQMVTAGETLARQRRVTMAAN